MVSFGRSKFHVALLVLAASMLVASAAEAAPPASCARRFVGTWRHEGGGTSNIAQLTADGVAACSGNAFCQQGTWTCDGNELTYNNGMSNTVYTLVSPNLMLAEGGRFRVTRIGGAPGLAEGAGNENLRDALSWMRAARAAAQYCTSANQIKASEDYDKAADAFAQAGDPGKQAMAHELALRADRKADACRLGTTGRGRRPSTPTAGDDDSQNACGQIQAQINALAQQGNFDGELSVYRQAQAGCHLKLHRPKAPLGSLTE